MKHIEYPNLSLNITDAESYILTEALEALRAVKMNALATVNVAFGSNPRIVPFSKADFGIDVIDALKDRIESLEETVPA
jgi:hypothetical protein